MRIAEILLLAACSMLPLSAGATGHFPHHRGQYGDWFWKDVQGFYSAHTNGARTPQEHFTVFCNDPGSRGGVAFSIGLVASQVGNRRLTLTFDNGRTIDVIANYARVSAASAQGQRIIGNVVGQLRTGRYVSVSQAGAPTARFSLRGSTSALARCP